MKGTLLLVMCIVGMALSGAVLILLIPSLFRSDDHGNVGIMGASGLLVLAFAAGARHWKPSVPATREDS